MRALRYEVISNQILNKLIEENKINVKYQEVYAYAIEKLLAGIGNALLLIFTSLLFRISIEMLVFILFYTPIRKYAGGIHAGTRAKCVAISLFVMIALIKLSNVIIVTDWWKMAAILVISGVILLVFRYAPVDCENKRLSPENKIKHKWFAKRVTITESLILVLCILYVPDFKKYIMAAIMAMMLAGIILIPIKNLKEDLNL
ncbi:MAG: accessory gene regulator ArgB-like protein [Mobilitalea sp.]